MSGITIQLVIKEMFSYVNDSTAKDHVLLRMTTAQ